MTPPPPPPDPPRAVPAGHVEAIWLAPSAGEPMEAVPGAEAVPGRGLRGDRYLRGTGHWQDHRWDELTLVEAEVAEALVAAGLLAGAGDLRRNVVTRGVPLGALVGRRFRLGPVEAEGLRPCAPCRYLEGLLDAPGLKRALRGRGGLRARILEGGRIRVGDSVRRVGYENSR